MKKIFISFLIIILLAALFAAGCSKGSAESGVSGGPVSSVSDGKNAAASGQDMTKAAYAAYRGAIQREQAVVQKLLAIPGMPMDKDKLNGLSANIVNVRGDETPVLILERVDLDEESFEPNLYSLVASIYTFDGEMKEIETLGIFDPDVSEECAVFTANSGDLYIYTNIGQGTIQATLEKCALVNGTFEAVETLAYTRTSPNAEDVEFQYNDKPTKKGEPYDAGKEITEKEFDQRVLAVTDHVDEMLLCDVDKNTSTWPDQFPSGLDWATNYQATSMPLAEAVSWLDKQLGGADDAGAAAAEAAKAWYQQDEGRTAYGVIILPKLDGTKIPNGGADKANAVIQKVRTEITDNEKEWEAAGGAPPQGGSDEILCDFRCALTGDVLSVEMQYHLPFSAPAMFGQSVNVDVKSGELLTPGQVFEKAGFPPDEVRASFFCYANKYAGKFIDRNQMIAWDNSVGDLSDQERYGLTKNLAENAQKLYDAACADGSLCVFLPESGALDIMAEVPTPGAGTGYWLERIHAGHNDTQTLELNDFIITAGSYPTDTAAGNGSGTRGSGQSATGNPLNEGMYAGYPGDSVYENPARGLVTATDGLNVRQEPSADSEILTALKFKTEIDLCGENNSNIGWYIVVITDKSGALAKGYVSKEYVGMA